MQSSIRSRLIRKRKRIRKDSMSMSQRGCSTMKRLKRCRMTSEKLKIRFSKWMTSWPIRIRRESSSWRRPTRRARTPKLYGTRWSSRQSKRSVICSARLSCDPRRIRKIFRSAWSPRVWSAVFCFIIWGRRISCSEPSTTCFSTASTGAK